MLICCFVFLLVIRRPPRSKRPDTLLPELTLFVAVAVGGRVDRGAGVGHHVEARDLERHAFGVAADAGLVAELVRHAGSGQAGVDFLARTEEHTSELLSPMRTSYAVFCLQQKKK